MTSSKSVDVVANTQDKATHLATIGLCILEVTHVNTSKTRGNMKSQAMIILSLDVL